MSRSEQTRLFEAERPRLFGIAYRMLGAVNDADDIVQEAWIRWDRVSGIDNPPAWLTTVTTRLAIDRLRSAEKRRETYIGPWLPEPLITDREDPAHILELNESLTLGFITVLDRLDPVDRAVFLLREVFDVPYAEVAAAVERTEANCRQIAKRARERVRAERPASQLASKERTELLGAFLGAVASGDTAVLEPLLCEDIIHLSDGGASRRAARRPVVGRDRVARLLINLASRVPPDESQLDLAEVNGQSGFVLGISGEPTMVVELEWEGSLVKRIHAVLNPDKLGRVHLEQQFAPGTPDSS